MRVKGHVSQQQYNDIAVQKCSTLRGLYMQIQTTHLIHILKSDESILYTYVQLYHESESFLQKIAQLLSQSKPKQRNDSYEYTRFSKNIDLYSGILFKPFKALFMHSVFVVQLQHSSGIWLLNIALSYMYTSVCGRLGQTTDVHHFITHFDCLTTFKVL